MNLFKTDIEAKAFLDEAKANYVSLLNEDVSKGINKEGLMKFISDLNYAVMGLLIRKFQESKEEGIWNSETSQKLLHEVLNIHMKIISDEGISEEGNAK